VARPLRIEYENATYHITCRGNDRRNIFSSDDDRFALLDLLDRSADIYQAEILAYVLMSNHFHLMVKTPRGNLREFMRHFNISYTARFNRRHHRSGHLYQGRYHSFLIDADNYLKEVSRYIHLNPIKIKQDRSTDAAAQGKALRSYAWSSYPGYLSSRARKPFLQVTDVLGYFGGDTAKGRRGYARYVEQGLAADLENPLELGKGHGIVGERDFVDEVRLRYLSPDADARELPAVDKIRGRVESERIVEAVCTELRVGREDLLKRGSRGIGRGILMELLYRYGGLKQPEIGAMMGIDYSAVSIARKRFQELMENDGDARVLMERLEGVLRQGYHEYK
jgi:REP element-mobilizing transposase RayT